MVGLVVQLRPEGMVQCMTPGSGWLSVQPEGVVEVAVDGLGAAAGRGVPGGAGADQLFELAAGGVAVFAAGVVATAFGDRGEGDVQFLQEAGERGGLPGVGTGSGGAGDRRRDPGVGAAGAAVRGGGAVGGEQGDAPAGAGVLGGGLEQAAGVVGVE